MTVDKLSNELETSEEPLAAFLKASNNTSLLSTINANSSTECSVAAQTSVTTGTLKVADTAGNFATQSVSVILGTIGGDTTNFTEASAGQIVFGFTGADVLTLLGHTIDASAISMFADYAANTSGDSIIFGGTPAAWTNATGSGSSNATAIGEWTITSGVAIRAGATVADFYAAFAGATGTVGEVVAFEDGGNTYLFGEGATNADTDNTAVMLVGITGITTVATAAAANTVTIA